jgi:hypothetical protein
VTNEAAAIDVHRVQQRDDILSEIGGVTMPVGVGRGFSLLQILENQAP